MLLNDVKKFEQQVGHRRFEKFAFRFYISKYISKCLNYKSQGNVLLLEGELVKSLYITIYWFVAL